jgi:hypothetical protein
MFIMECYPLKAEKRYSHCVVSLAQAFELFFSHFLYHRLVQQPLTFDPDFPSAKDYQRLSDLLSDATEHLGYKRLRNVFFHVLLNVPALRTREEAERVIATIEALCNDPSDATLAGHPDPAVADLLLALKTSTVVALRNRVAHHEGYRPSLEEVERAIDETRAILFPLSARLALP